MYKISVPVINFNLKRNGRDRTLQELKRFRAERVFLALSFYELNPAKRKAVMQELADNCRFFQDNGFEVGAWIWTFLVNEKADFRNMRSITGKELPDYMCPSDEAFVAFATDYIREVAQCGVDIIQFDDDFRYGFLTDAPACLCDGHIALINQITGQESTREELAHHITTGGKNKFRDAYLQANGDLFRNFARAVRASVDQVNPNIRVGTCSCMSSWDIDGTDAYELSKILAGNTKPFVRLIGAPYWSVQHHWGNYLQDVVELERMESAWTVHEDIEIMAEGDVFPRPRINCPASYLEGFDTAIRASSCTDGILKYGIDYTSNADYETGYARFHERNLPVYDAINEMFRSKTSCGIRVYESMKKLSDMVMPTKVNQQVDIQNLFFSKASRALVCNSIPTTYQGTGTCTIVFDENARSMPLEYTQNGLIMDIAAAEILTERGVDVGLKSIGNAFTGGIEEHFLSDNNHISVGNATVYDIAIDSNAEILSDTTVDAGCIPISYRYENAEGCRFLVLNLNTRFDESCMLKHYARGRQFADNVYWLSGKPLPAYVYGHPSLYLQAKEQEEQMAVGLWNFFADIAIDPVVELGKSYYDIRFINCSGKLDGSKVYLSDIPPFAFAGFEVK